MIAAMMPSNATVMSMTLSLTKRRSHAWEHSNNDRKKEKPDDLEGGRRARVGGAAAGEIQLRRNYSTIPARR